MKHKVSELTGALLDAAVAMAEGRKYDLHLMTPHGVDFVTVVDHEQSGWVAWSPSRVWADGGPIIERERIVLVDRFREMGGYFGMCGTAREGGGTHLIAAMRAYIASKFGAEVDLPD